MDNVGKHLSLYNSPYSNNHANRSMEKLVFHLSDSLRIFLLNLASSLLSD